MHYLPLVPTLIVNTTKLLQIYVIKKALKLKKEIKRNGLLAYHAEENAINKYFSNLSYKNKKHIPRRKLHIIVIRINNNAQLLESKPCSHCVEVMRSYGIRKVTYSNKNGELVTELLNDIKSESSLGYRSIERTMNILDEIIKNHEKISIC